MTSRSLLTIAVLLIAASMARSFWLSKRRGATRKEVDRDPWALGLMIAGLAVVLSQLVVRYA